MSSEQSDMAAQFFGFENADDLEAFIAKHKQPEPVMPGHSKIMAAEAEGFASALDMHEDFALHHRSMLRESLNFLRIVAHGNAVNAGWYHDVNTGKWKNLNIGERFMLMVTELAEGFEGFRKDRMDDHLPHRSNMEVELADLVIRCMDFAGAEDLDIAGAIFEKMEYNRHRPDHKPENRAAEGGKKC